MLATRIADVLTAHGVAHFYGPAHLRGAAEWHDEIGRALARCDWFVVLLSPDATKSAWVKHELLYALDKASYRERIVPVVIRRCDPERLSWTLSQIQHVSFLDGFHRGCRDLLRIWDIDFASEASEAGSRPRGRRRR